MVLTDVWRNVNDEIGIFWNGRFDRVWDAPGVYAWFYPLRITSTDLNVFLEEIATVLSFDARFKGSAVMSLEGSMAWEKVRLIVSLHPRRTPLPADALEAWKRATDNPESFDRLRRVVMKGSLLMPPLYVGKTRSLLTRCQQHLAGTGQNDFHSRFTDYAIQSRLPATRIDDLLLACIKTAAEQVDDPSDEIEGLLEEILKRACRPRFSVK